MFRDYFIFNGKKYYTGTVVKTNDTTYMPEATFVCYDERYGDYVFRSKGRTTRGLRVLESRMQECIIDVTDKVDTSVKMPEVKKKNDAHIDGLFLGWVWYIFLMGISVIFKDVIGLWIIISVVFFSWRSKKIKEEGTYIEW